MSETPEIAWLIEFQSSVLPGNSSVVYYGRVVKGLGPTTKHLDALRFARKQDAEALIDEFGWTEAKAVDHMWCEPQKEQTPPDE